MNHSDELNQLLQPLLDPRLLTSLSDINLTPLSRIPPSRLQETALQDISLIELVPSPAFATLYQPLYETLFHGGERERSSRIIQRLSQDAAGARAYLAPYRLLGIRDRAGAAVAAAHFSILMLPARRDGGGADPTTRLAVPYLQYIYVRASHRRRDLSELLHALILGVTVGEARRMGMVTGEERGMARIVPFTLFETEPPEHDGEVSGERTRIHARGGSVAMMVRDWERQGGEGGGGRGRRKVVSAHVQPGLEVGEPPVTLVWVLRPNPETGSGVDEDLVRERGAELLRAYYQSLRDEGFEEENIALSERMVAKRIADREFVVIPLAEVTGEMYRNID